MEYIQRAGSPAHKESQVIGDVMAKCSICGGSGLVPFVKNGKVISNAYLNCTCKPEPVEHHEYLKQTEIARMWGISKQRVNQLIKKAKQ